MVDRREPDRLSDPRNRPWVSPTDRSVSAVIPARNEAAYIDATLSSCRELIGASFDEIIVVDGESTDETVPIARDHGVTVVTEPERSIARARNVGARRATGEWLAFVDADTVLDPSYLSAMLTYVDLTGRAAASSYCRITGPVRAKLMQGTINRLFPRLTHPILPGFNTFVHRAAFDALGGFPDVPNEDTAFSRRLAAEYPTGYCPRILVETSGRRVAADGLTGTLWHYARLDVGRVRATGVG
ncbi:family 2 glycosyl transferase [Halovivax asiaticus JCM 14624]|uniref:Family 2 glycosyl transferase n=1 Tax=Halovivax asiaticus JCM 14624 TaxID=1227490 RepID=M0BCU8_9EURY|nr:glycosyltransferase [Halovivax asiaticus]ELZ08297.1 family 2 glycosyl transferase [Halovivax asiaticus JCM 14624]